MLGRSNKRSLYYSMTDLYEKVRTSEQMLEYYPMTDLYKNVWTFEQMFWILSYDWPV